MKSDYYLFLLSKIKGLGSSGINNLIKDYGTLTQDKINLLPERYKRIIKLYLADKNFLRETEAEWHNIDEPYISIYNANYPKILKNIYDPPLFLFYRGNIKLLSSNNILTVVGSRRLTSYHESNTNKLIGQLQNSKIIIASGMAEGIDSIAHNAALDNNLLTIAVLGSGLGDKIIYPQKNLSLAKKIITNNGLLLSEYSQKSKTQIHNFPKRNRILAGIAKTILVISGAKKSGTLITAQVAIDEGRDVYALPGNIDSTLSEGPNNLISNGAHILKSAKDILNNYNINYKLKNKKIVFKNKIHAKIYSILQTESLNLIILSRKVKISPEALNICISEMELEGLIKINKKNIIEIL